MIKFIIIAIWSLSFACAGYVAGHLDKETNCQEKVDWAVKWWTERVRSEKEFYQWDSTFKCKRIKKFKHTAF